MSYSSEVLADSPLLYWKLDETGFADGGSNGTSFLSGSGVVTQKTPLLSDGGYAASGSGSAPVATLGSVPASITGANVTLEAWVKIPAANTKGSFVKVGSSANGWGMGIGGTQWDNVGKKLVLLSEQVAWLPTTYTFTTGVHHVMVVRGASGAVTAYVDGASVWSGTLSSPIAASGQVGVGGYTTPNAFSLNSDIDIDNAAIYSSALSSARASAHYSAGTGDNSAVAADSPLIWLKLDENASALTAADSSTNNRTGTTHSGVALGQGSLLGSGVGKSAYYSNNAFTNLPGAAWMDAASFTAECRIKLSSTSGDQYVASRWTSSGLRVWLLFVSSGKLSARVAVGGNETLLVTGATTLTVGTIYTVSLTYDGSNINVYLNGVLDGTLSAPGTPRVANTADLELARAAQAVYGNMTIDEFSFTGSALSATRLSARHAAAIASGNASGTIGAALPPLAASIAGAYGPSGSVSGALPSLTASIAGTFQLPGTSGDLTATLPSLAGDLEGSYALAGQVAATLPALTGNLSGSVEVDAGLAATLPSLTGSLAGVLGDDFLIATLPSLQATMSGYSLAIVGTDTTVGSYGYSYAGSGVLDYDPPVTPEPAHGGRAHVRRIHRSMPTPTLTDGSPR